MDGQDASSCTRTVRAFMGKERVKGRVRYLVCSQFSQSSPVVT